MSLNTTEVNGVLGECVLLKGIKVLKNHCLSKNGFPRLLEPSLYNLQWIDIKYYISLSPESKENGEKCTFCMYVGASVFMDENNVDMWAELTIT